MQEQEQSEAKLFFGLQIQAAWPERLPEGRLVAEEHRHLTCLFLGTHQIQRVLDHVSRLPPPQLALGPAGIFSKCLFFPEKRPRCVAWQIDWLTQKEPFFSFQKALEEHFVQAEFIQKERRDYVPHVTVCRPPFHRHEWQKAFYPIPCFAKGLHLYESLGHSTYRSLWNIPFLEAIQEIEHTADMAFRIRAKTLQELHTVAEIALAFTYPPFIGYFAKEPRIDTFEDIISDLNAMIAQADSTIGCPLKAVSYHGEVKKIAPNILEWEMIIDV